VNLPPREHVTLVNIFCVKIFSLETVQLSVVIHKQLGATFFIWIGAELEINKRVQVNIGENSIFIYLSTFKAFSHQS